MLKPTNRKFSFSNSFRIDRLPLDTDEIRAMRVSLRSAYLSYLNGVFALVVLSVGLTIRVITLQIENAIQVLEIGLYTGFWIGLFAGVSIFGPGGARVRMALTGIIACCSASISASMLVTLFLGYPVSWISSVNILASALAGMWLLTHYDGAIKNMALVKYVNTRELTYIIRAAELFENIDSYGKKIKEKQRRPVLAEYWVIRNWIRSRGEQ